MPPAILALEALNASPSRRKTSASLSPGFPRTGYAVVAIRKTGFFQEPDPFIALGVPFFCFPYLSHFPESGSWLPSHPGMRSIWGPYLLNEYGFPDGEKNGRTTACLPRITPGNPDALYPARFRAYGLDTSATCCRKAIAPFDHDGVAKATWRGRARPTAAVLCRRRQAPPPLKAALEPLPPHLHWIRYALLAQAEYMCNTPGGIGGFPADFNFAGVVSFAGAIFSEGRTGVDPHPRLPCCSSTAMPTATYPIPTLPSTATGSMAPVYQQEPCRQRRKTLAAHLQGRRPCHCYPSYLP